MNWKRFFVVVLLVVCIHTSSAKKYKKNKSKKKKNKRRASSAPPRPPTNCKLDGNGEWVGEGCSEFMAGDKEESLKSQETGNLTRYGLDWVLHPFSREEYFEKYYQKKHYF